MALVNLGLVFLVFAGVHRLETALYERCVERVGLDRATEHFRQVLVDEAHAQAAAERGNPFIDDQLRQRRVASHMRVAAAGQAAIDARVTTPCTRLRLLGFGD